MFSSKLATISFDFNLSSLVKGCGVFFLGIICLTSTPAPAYYPWLNFKCCLEINLNHLASPLFLLVLLNHGLTIKNYFLKCHHKPWGAYYLTKTFNEKHYSNCTFACSPWNFFQWRRKLNQWNITRKITNFKNERVCRDYQNWTKYRNEIGILPCFSNKTKYHFHITTAHRALLLFVLPLLWLYVRVVMWK